MDRYANNNIFLHKATKRCNNLQVKRDVQQILRRIANFTALCIGTTEQVLVDRYVSTPVQRINYGP
jgi:hypothetical protein